MIFIERIKNIIKKLTTVLTLFVSLHKNCLLCIST